MQLFKVRIKNRGVKSTLELILGSRFDPLSPFGILYGKFDLTTCLIEVRYYQSESNQIGMD